MSHICIFHSNAPLQIYPQPLDSLQYVPRVEMLPVITGTYSTIIIIIRYRPHSGYLQLYTRNIVYKVLQLFFRYKS